MGGEPVYLEDSAMGDLAPRFVEFTVTNSNIVSLVFIASATDDADQVQENEDGVVADGWCGFLVDNVKLQCSTNALTGIEAINNGNNSFTFTPILSTPLDIKISSWEVAGVAQDEESSTLNYTFLQDGIYQVCFYLQDERDCCAQTCVEVEVGEVVEGLCSYRLCLDCAETGDQRLNFITTSGNTADFFGNSLGDLYVASALQWDITEMNTIWKEAQLEGYIEIIQINNELTDGCRGPWIYIRDTDVVVDFGSFEQFSPYWGMNTINNCPFDLVI